MPPGRGGRRRRCGRARTPRIGTGRGSRARRRRHWWARCRACLSANGDGTYGVGRGFISQDLGLFATAQEAVAVAVRQLSSSPGPTSLGG
ncbi:DUF6193 family natural product biosynthesis protein [Streptomyces sp. ISL-1]|uniref:DUF6193 family natural product biosynthesis protein n=1 Tax=Streptomyces sp. ISL-1 TaxID=2817657 RepID=UPI002034CA1A|nr:DUF6193 family natural product biosynthesis protein [Streptomyces sp. ISL-1]